MNKLSKVQKSKVQFFYELHRTPPGLLSRMPDGTTFRSYLDGRTFWLLNGQHEVPAPGCPFPAQLFAANVAAFLFRNRRMVLNTLFLLAILVVGQFFLWQLPGAPIDELKLSFVALLSFALNGVLIVLLCLAVVAFFIWNFGKGIALTRENPEPVLALGEGAISIAPDVLVMSQGADENPGELADRIDRVRSAQKDGVWIAILTFQHADGLVIFSPAEYGADEEFDGFRFGREAWTGAYAAGNQQDYTRETWAQYLAYCQQFARDFSEWSAQAKPKRVDPVKALTLWLRAAAGKAAYVAAFLLCLTGSLFAQKSVQVARYLGEYRYSNDRPHGEVKFVFQKAVLPRSGDGTKTYKEILPTGAMFSDRDNAGRLIGITVAGQTIQPEAPAQKDTEKPVVVNLATNEARPIPDMLPDSMEMERRLDNAKEQVDKWKSGAWAAVRPVWRFIMWLFTACVLPILIGLGGMLRYVAKTAAGESAVNLYGTAIFGKFMVRVHQNTAGALMLIVWIATGVMLINSFMWLVWWNYSWWVTLPVWALELWIAEMLTNWIVPNMRVANPNGTSPNRLPQING